MRIGFQIILFLVILNLTSGLLYATSVPGSYYGHILTGTGDPEEYAERFNATEFMESTEPSASAAITFVGHIWAALDTVWFAIRLVLIGFPDMLLQLASQIGDPTARATFRTISYVLIGVNGLIMMMWLFQLLSGREVED